MAGLLHRIDPWVNDLIKNYMELYKQCVSKRQSYVHAMALLSMYANPGEASVCNGYLDIRNKFWDKGKKKIEEADLEFNNDLVGKDDNSFVHPMLYQRYGNRENVIKKRKELRPKVVEAANDLLKSIQKLRQVKVGKRTTIWDVGYFYGFATWNVPKNFMDAFKKAVALDNLKGTYYYRMLKEEPDQNYMGLTNEFVDILNDHNHKLALKRKIAVNLLTGWDIKEFNDPIIPADIQENVIPMAPATIPQNEEQLLDAACWGAYVERLTFKNIPALERDLHAVGVVGTNWLDNISFWRPAIEYYSWGKAKNGKILFSDNQTYQLGQNIEPVATKYNKGKYNKAQLGEDADQKIDEFIRPIRKALRNLGAVAVQDNNLVILGNDEENNENNNENQGQ